MYIVILLWVHTFHLIWVNEQMVKTHNIYLMSLCTYSVFLTFSVRLNYILIMISLCVFCKRYIFSLPPTCHCSQSSRGLFSPISAVKWDAGRVGKESVTTTDIINNIFFHSHVWLSAAERPCQREKGARHKNQQAG